MLINDHIEYLHRVITGIKCGDIIEMGIFNKMFSIGVISIFNSINRDLEKLSSQLDTSINLEAVSIKFDQYLNKEYWTKTGWFFNVENVLSKLGVEIPPISYTTEINQITDYLPNGQKGYLVTPQVLDSFKNAMHMLCQEERLSYRDINYALNLGLSRMLKLLMEVEKKVKNPKAHLFAKLWEETMEIFHNDEYAKEYNEWIEENDTPTFADLQVRQRQEIFKLLNKNFFRFCEQPTGAEVRNRKLIITEDDLAFGTEIPSNFSIECAKFEKFFVWKGDAILYLNYEKLGRYIYKHYNQFDENEFFCITDFDRIMDLIHEEMAKQKPSLAKNLKRYEENKIAELQKDCEQILLTCKPLLKKDVNGRLLEVYLEKLLYDKEIKMEARSKLSGQSKKKYICEMIADLSNCFVFDPQYGEEDFAQCLHEKINDIEKITLKRYIQEAESARSGALYTWTRKVMDGIIQSEQK